MKLKSTYVYAVLIMLSLVLFFYNLGTREFYDTIESRRLLIAMEMAQTGDWLIPRIEGHILVTKPPLFYWLVAGLIKIFGTTAEWTVRFPSACAAALCLVVMYYIARLITPPRMRGYSIVLPVILATTTMFRGCARLGEPDMIMTFFSTTAVLFFLLFREKSRRVYALLFFLFMGVGIFTKGPLGAIITLLTILPYSIIYHRPKDFLSLPWISGAGILLLMLIPWMLLTWSR